MNPVIQVRDARPHELPDNLHPILRRIYAARGVQRGEYLSLGLERLINFESLKGIDTAIALLMNALEGQQRILIVGDYDADGATSTALLLRMLPKFGFKQVDYLLPNRFEFGYGLSPAIVEVAKQRNPDLIITVDNGIASVEGVAAAKSADIKVLITDHHLPGDVLPEADAIVNPNQPGCDFPSKMLAGVGVVFYILMALRAALREQGWFAKQEIAEPNLAEVLDIVALGTVADVVPLDYNNRILVEQGLRRIRSGHMQPGIQALIKASGRDYRYLGATDLGFAIGPRINAAGRLDDMSVGVECLLANDVQTAAELADGLNEMNMARREISQSMQQEAQSLLSDMDLSKDVAPTFYCLYQSNWHQGVTGILAGRVKDELHRPVIVFADGDEGELKGSARSIPGFHMRDALDAVASKHTNLITRFGGHAMAAGLTLAKDKLEEFQNAINEYALANLTDDHLQRTVLTDGELRAEDIDLPLAILLEQAGPWGQGFPSPLFQGKFNIISQRRIGADNNHLKLVLEAAGNHIDAVAFSIDDADWSDDQSQIDIVYRLSVNRFRGSESVQLMVERVIRSHDASAGLV